MADWLEVPNRRNASNDRDLKEEVHRLRPAEELMISGARLYCEGEFDLAAQEFHRARRHEPSLFDAWAEEVDARLRDGDVPRAAEVATEAISTYGRVPIFYAAKALVLAHKGYMEAAYEHSDISVKHQGASMFTWLSRGEVVLATGAPGSLHSAEACFEKARLRDPSRWRASFRAALSLLQWSHTPRALQLLAQVSQLIPANPFVWKLMGDCHLQLGHGYEARQCYRTALARRPGYPPADEALQAMTFWGRLRAKLRSLFRGTHKA